jgi:antitoxin ParD1/3/4
MSSIEKISIALPPEMIARVREAVESGEYASASEVIRDALRDWTHKRTLRQAGIDDLRRLWQQALSYNTSGVSPHDVFEQLERKYQALADARGDQEQCA